MMIHAESVTVVDQSQHNEHFAHPLEKRSPSFRRYAVQYRAALRSGGSRREQARWLVHRLAG